MCSTVLKTRSDIEHIQRKENGWTEQSFLENNTYITTKIEAYGFLTIFKKLREYIVERIEKSLILQGMCGLLIPCIAILGSLLVVAWPQHNVIDHPQYWYEVMGPVIIGNYLVTITVGLMDCHMIMKFHFIWSMKVFLKMFFVNIIGFVVPYRYYITIILCHSLVSYAGSLDLFPEEHNFGFFFQLTYVTKTRM